MSVIVPDCSPFTITFTPGIPSPSTELVTFPDTAMSRRPSAIADGSNAISKPRVTMVKMGDTNFLHKYLYFIILIVCLKTCSFNHSKIRYH